jgi:hypothetical protein
MIEKLNLKPVTEIKLRLVVNVLTKPPFSCEMNRFKLIKESFKEIDKMFNKNGKM